jgi:hypothetical protein
MKRVVLVEASVGKVIKIVDSNRTLKCPMDRYMSCGDWCAWFDVKETREFVCDIVLCKGNPIAELDNGCVIVEIEE